MEDAILEIPVDGRWTLNDLDDFAEALRLCYAYYCSTSEQTQKDEQRIAFLMQRYFWAGTYQGDDFAAKLYAAIPDEGQPFIKRFEYASPGLIEIAAAAPALGALSLAVRSWLKTGSVAFQLYKDIDEFFAKRRLARIPKNFALDTLGPSRKWWNRLVA